MTMRGGFIVLDFGSQYTQLITRRLRELQVYSEILRFDTPLDELRGREPAGIILSGGPSSVSEAGAPVADVKGMMEIAPVLGICYGMQLLTKQLGGVVEAAEKREYGLTHVVWKIPLPGVPPEQKVWMSHGDVVRVPPPGFEIMAESKSGHPAALRGMRALAFQFHPEVAHTSNGVNVLEAFVFGLCKAEPNWDAPHILEHLRAGIRSQVPDNESVLCALSGGVDSTVVATLLSQALGRQHVDCVFVNNGLLRKNEYEDVMNQYRRLDLNVRGVDASEIFLGRLAGVQDPEEKRKIIGRTFIDVFKEAIRDGHPTEWLAQGTLYPDVIESVSLRGAGVTIKSHHNVGGLPEDLDLKLIEPLRDLFKDEVRLIGEKLGIAHSFLWRHPFPGPGLAIRVLGEVTPAALEVLRNSDAIFIEELRQNGLYEKIWQAFAVLLPVKTVGVQGDFRTYENVVGLRAVTSSDGMTADWFPFEPEFLRHVSNRITNEVRGVNRVVYDITSKPPGTIEWE